MTSLFPARRRAEEFAALVDSDDRGGLATAYPDLEPVLGSLRSIELVEPRQEFSDELRSLLVAQAHTLLRPESAGLSLPVRPRTSRERRLVVVASAAVLIGGTASMAAAAQRALPGEALYPLKRGIESVESRLSSSDAGKGRDLLEQASGRLAEVRGLLADNPTTPQVAATLSAFTTQAADGADLMFTSYQSTGDPATITAVRSFSATAIADLSAIADQVPNDAQDELADAAQMLHDIDQQAAVLCGACSDAAVVQVPAIFLARADVGRAFDLISAKQLSQLDNSHPVVVPTSLSSSVDVTDDGSKTPAAGGDDATEPGKTPALPDPTDPTGIDGLPDLLGGTKSDTGTKDVTDPVKDLGAATATLLPDPTQLP